jgi:hypothetical protein
MYPIGLTSYPNGLTMYPNNLTIVAGVAGRPLFVSVSVCHIISFFLNISLYHPICAQMQMLTRTAELKLEPILAFMNPYCPKRYITSSKILPITINLVSSCENSQTRLDRRQVWNSPSTTGDRESVSSQAGLFQSSTHDGMPGLRLSGAGISRESSLNRL